MHQGDGRASIQLSVHLLVTSRTTTRGCSRLAHPAQKQSRSCCRHLGSRSPTPLLRDRARKQRFRIETVEIRDIMNINKPCNRCSLLGHLTYPLFTPFRGVSPHLNHSPRDWAWAWDQRKDQRSRCLMEQVLQLPLLFGRQLDEYANLTYQRYKLRIRHCRPGRLSRIALLDHHIFRRDCNRLVTQILDPMRILRLSCTFLRGMWSENRCSAHHGRILDSQHINFEAEVKSMYGHLPLAHSVLLPVGTGFPESSCAIHNAFRPPQILSFAQFTVLPKQSEGSLQLLPSPTAEELWHWSTDLHVPVRLHQSCAGISGANTLL
jgi:hypothetical protein